MSDKVDCSLRSENHDGAGILGSRLFRAEVPGRASNGVRALRGPKRPALAMRPHSLLGAGPNREVRWYRVWLANYCLVIEDARSFGRKRLLRLRMVRSDHALRTLFAIINMKIV